MIEDPVITAVGGNQISAGELVGVGGEAEGKMVNGVLTLAYYRFVENLSYNQLKQWQREVKAPSKRVLDSKAITCLAQSITEQHRMDLFRCRAKRTKKESCARLTRLQSLHIRLQHRRHPLGKNKEKLPLRQTLEEVVVYSLTSRMPIYYKELPGNIPDSRTLDLIIKELERMPDFQTWCS